MYFEVYGSTSAYLEQDEARVVQVRVVLIHELAHGAVVVHVCSVLKRLHKAVT